LARAILLKPFITPGKFEIEKSKKERELIFWNTKGFTK